MFYPKLIYENLPYVYFLICAYLLAFYSSWVVFISAGFFYCAGCITLVTRSEHRRLDRRQGLESLQSHKSELPEWLYEYLPYCYFAVAMSIVLKTHSHALQFIAFCLMILALRNLLFRRSNRRKAKSLF